MENYTNNQATLKYRIFCFCFSRLPVLPEPEVVDRSSRRRGRLLITKFGRLFWIVQKADRINFNQINGAQRLEVLGSWSALIWAPDQRTTEIVPVLPLNSVWHTSFSKLPPSKNQIDHRIDRVKVFLILKFKI